MRGNNFTVLTASDSTNTMNYKLTNIILCNKRSFAQGGSPKKNTLPLNAASSMIGWLVENPQKRPLGNGEEHDYIVTSKISKSARLEAAIT